MFWSLEYWRVNTKSDIASSPRTTLVIWTVATTLLSARTQLLRPGTALTTPASVRFPTLPFRPPQPISCSTAASLSLYLYRKAHARKWVFPENCKTSNLVVEFCFVIKLLKLTCITNAFNHFWHVT